MSEINRVALFGKLNSLAYKAIEGATVFCKLRGNPYVELVHWVHQILQHQTPTCTASCAHFELDACTAGDRTSPRRWIGCRAAPPRSPTCRPTSRTPIERGWV